MSDIGLPVTCAMPLGLPYQAPDPAEARRRARASIRKWLLKKMHREAGRDVKTMDSNSLEVLKAEIAHLKAREELLDERVEVIRELLLRKCEKCRRYKMLFHLFSGM